MKDIEEYEEEDYESDLRKKLLAKEEKGELKPCPFCGGESRLFETGFYSWMVACTRCCCRTHEEDLEEDAIRIWNRRVDE